MKVPLFSFSAIFLTLKKPSPQILMLSFKFSSWFYRTPLPPIIWATLGTLIGTALPYFKAPYTVKSLVISCGIFCLLIYVLPIRFPIKQNTYIFLLFLVLSSLRSHTFTMSFLESTQAVTQKTLSGEATIFSKEKGSLKFYRSCLVLKIRSLSNLPVPSRSTLKIYCAHPSPCLPGDHISFKGLHVTQQNSSHVAYGYRKGLIGTLFCKKFNHTLINRPFLSWRRLQDHLRTSMSHAISKQLSPETDALFSALFLGSKTKNLPVFLSLFSYWGIMHFLARSGLHVVILVGIGRFLFRVLAIPFMISQLLLMIFLGLYYFLTWPSISFERAIASFYLCQVYVLGKISFQLIPIICLITTATLLWNPLVIQGLDFQLSFGLTFALALYNEMRHQRMLIGDQNHELN